MMRLAGFVIGIFFLSGAAGADEAGTVLFAKGSVNAERDQAIPLHKGDIVMTADTIVTGDASRAQLQMIDGAKIALRPNSRLRIEEYRYDPAPAATVSGSDDSGVMNLVKGGFRTITGAIGEKDKSDYEVRTAVGVLGIRGTDYALVFCSGDCQTAPGVATGAPIEDGLYVGVNTGAIVFQNASGEIVVRAGQFAFIPLKSQEPEILDAAPAILIDDNDLKTDADGAPSSQQPDDDPTQGFNAKFGTRRTPPDSSAAPDGTDDKQESDTAEAPKQPVIAIGPDGTPVDITSGSAPDPQGVLQISFSAGPLGAADPVWSSTQENESSQVQSDSGGNLTRFEHSYPARAGFATYNIGTASNTDTGLDAMTVMRWGRWSGGTVQITLSDGSNADQDFVNQSLHWITGQGNAPVMPVSGSTTYTLIGGTSPTDTLGNTGVLGSMDLFADFTNLRVVSTLALTINGSSWSASGNGSIGAAAQLPAHLFNGTYSVDVDGATGGTGVFSGFFSEPGPSSDPVYPGGVGLTYSLTHPQSPTSVSGAAALGNP